MPNTFIKNHKKASIFTAAFLGIILFFIYLYIMFLPGYDYQDAFLFKQKDGGGEQK